MLETNYTYILETHMKIICWIGKEASVEEKKNSIAIGKGLMKKKNKPKGCRVMRVCENCE